MKKFNEYVKAKTEKFLVIHDEYQDDFHHYSEFGTFLSTIAEKHYKNEKMLAFFRNLNSSIGVAKDELVEYLETTKKGYVKARLQNDPLNFSTNPMLNLIQLWDFEFYAEMIKEIDILLSKC